MYLSIKYTHHTFLKASSWAEIQKQPLVPVLNIYFELNDSHLAGKTLFSTWYPALVILCVTRRVVGDIEFFKIIHLMNMVGTSLFAAMMLNI